MSYRLIIVDDEEHIREGLNDLVDWDALGFQVAARLGDGQEALDWLQKTEVDVILTDIKMTFLSGLELAQYVHENRIPTKIVLISGYQEFEYAKQAMGYNVVNYLLKPTSLDEISRVFRQVKRQLDEEKEEREALSRMKKQNEQLLPALRKQVLRDLTAGKLQDCRDTEKLFRLAKMDADTLNHRCALTTLHLLLPDRQDQQMHGNSLIETVENMAQAEVDGVLYVPIQSERHRIRVFAFELRSSSSSDTLRTAVMEYIQKIGLRIRTLLGIEVRAEFECAFDSVSVMVEERHRFEWRETEWDEVTSVEHAELAELAELQRQLLSYVNACNFEALPARYDLLIEEAVRANAPVKSVRHALIELFSALSAKLNERDLPLDKITNRTFYYESILRLDSYAELRSWGLSVLGDISDYMEQRQSSALPAFIQKAKAYVALHFDKDISLENAAAHVYLSPDYFSRLFKQHTGSNYIDYVVEMRVNKAMEYLQDPQFKVYEIGSIVGYKNTKYFFKLFKKHTGFTPSEYRRKTSGEELQ